MVPLFSRSIRGFLFSSRWHWSVSFVYFFLLFSGFSDLCKALHNALYFFWRWASPLWPGVLGLRELPSWGNTVGWGSKPRKSQCCSCNHVLPAVLCCLRCPRCSLWNQLWWVRVGWIETGWLACLWLCSSPNNSDCQTLVASPLYLHPYHWD